MNHTFQLSIRTPTPTPYLTITATESEIIRIDFSAEPIRAEHIPPVLQHCATELEEYFAGTRQQFTVPLSPHGTSFQKKVWSALRDIEYGVCKSYKDIALALSAPTYTRAVGAANGKNPISIIIPCHRVIGSNGQLVGYAGGLDNKKWLLQHEQESFHFTLSTT